MQSFEMGMVESRGENFRTGCKNLRTVAENLRTSSENLSMGAHFVLHTVKQYFAFFISKLKLGIIFSEFLGNSSDYFSKKRNRIAKTNLSKIPETLPRKYMGHGWSLVKPIS